MGKYKIKRNRVQCLICNEIIESTYTHDYVTCSCGNVSVDGGYDYLKRAAKDISSFLEMAETEPVEEIDTSIPEEKSETYNYIKVGDIRVDLKKDNLEYEVLVNRQCIMSTSDATEAEMAAESISSALMVLAMDNYLKKTAN